MSQKTILHLDDESDIRDLVAAYLTGKGYRMISVASPGEALEAARREPIDLVITDLQLEEADGMATIDQLAKIRPKTPVMILTGVMISPTIAKQTIGQRAACFVEKTTPLAQILEVVQRLLGG
ncbi:MAG: response regulator [Opitutales bacterium]